MMCFFSLKRQVCSLAFGLEDILSDETLALQFSCSDPPGGRRSPTASRERGRDFCEPVVGGVSIAGWRKIKENKQYNKVK